MHASLECVPNFSEGRRTEVIEALAAALRHPGVSLLDVHADPDHNRSVFTMVGEAVPLIDSVFAAVEVATERIDLRVHTGAHPRIGATDVVPFVPLGRTPMEVAVSAARQLGERVASSLGIPVFFYEDAATMPERQNLEQVRRKGYEELRDAAGTADWRAPDLGPQAVHESAGAIIVGARRPLIAYNIYLNSPDIKVARAIARAVRHSSGGLRYVKALGLSIPERGCVQVSMNLTNFHGTSMSTAFEMVRGLAESYGVSVIESEVVGLVPAEALFDAARHYLRMHAFKDQQVLEMRLLHGED